MTEDTKDRRPKTNRTVNDRVALQKGGDRNGGLHDNANNRFCKHAMKDSVMVRAFSSEAGGAGSNPGRVIPKTLKMVPVAWRSALLRQALASLLSKR